MNDQSVTTDFDARLAEQRTREQAEGDRLTTILQAVAKAMGGEFHDKRSREFAHADAGGNVTFGELSLYLYAGGYQHADKITCRPNMPKPKTGGDLYETTKLRATVSAGRDPEKIAAEFTRKVLTPFREEFKTYMARIEAVDSAENKRRALQEKYGERMRGMIYSAVYNTDSIDLRMTVPADKMDELLALLERGS